MKTFLQLLFLFVAVSGFGQIDNEFWFGAPELTEGTASESRRDSTIYLVFSSFDNPTEIRILQPANLSFEPIVLNLAPNTTDRVNLGTFLSLIETKPANQILSTGLLIRADEPITAYYEVAGANNTDIWSLKGKNSLGTQFFTPFQTEFQNNQTLGGQAYMPPPRSGFIVMATRDTTTVEITPSIDILGHPAGETFSIILNRGETYYCEAIDGSPESKPGGTLIESDKDITVTTKDDMIDVEPSNDGGADVIGDQLIAAEFLGTEHIAIKGDLNNNSERLVLVGTVDNTEITISGEPDAIFLDRGEQFLYTLEESAVFIESSEDISLFQVSGRSDQIAGAAIPSLGCTGSNVVGFVRGGPAPFWLNITIRAGEEDGFELNGDPNLVAASDFSEVPGSDGEYVFARIQFSNTEVPVGEAHVLTNFGDELFHLATMNGNQASCNYGYFSAFSYLNIGNTAEVCLNDSLVLDAGPGKTSYLWNTGDTTRFLEVESQGIYYVDVFSGTDCFATDTIEVIYYEPPIDLGPNDTICEGTSTVLEADGNYLFEWQDGSENSTLEVSEPGIYWVQVVDFQGCAFRDSIEISVSPRPETPEISGSLEYCQGETLDLSMPDFEDAAYRYILPSGEIAFTQNLVIENIQPEDVGEYIGFYVVEGCESFADTVEVNILSSPQFDLGDDISVCEDQPVILDPGITEGNFEWQDGSGGEVFIPTESGTYFLNITNEIGCVGSDTIEVEFRTIPPAPDLDIPTSYCVGEEIVIELSGLPETVFTVSVPGRPTFTGAASTYTIADVEEAQTGTITLSAELEGCISEVTSLDIIVHPNPTFAFAPDTTICTGDEVSLSGPENMDTYTWSTGDETQTISVGAGSYTLVFTDQNGCSGETGIDVFEQGPTAAFFIEPDTIAPPGTFLSFIDQSSAGDFPIVSWLWDFGNGDISQAELPGYAYEESGIFTVNLIITDALGCESTASQRYYSIFDFAVPEGFSPNGDGINDRFEIRGLQLIDGAVVQIFNRWGGVVYESNDYGPGNYWDGDDAPDGTYFYIIEIPEQEPISGNVTIAR
ncbi:MAG TPA: gliding motility-associated C-terminal domain-containing protein [Cryomorphaceae bacterium]|nr:gliding motility-associated C-terminal domain-containing protein [Cryomorphaceae bacterium]